MSKILVATLAVSVSFLALACGSTPAPAAPEGAATAASAAASAAATDAPAAPPAAKP